VDLARWTVRSADEAAWAMLPAWATVALALGSALIGGAIGLLGGWLTNRYAVARDRARREEERVREGAAVVAPVSLVLSDAHPDRLGVNLDRADPLGRLKELRARWESLRAPLAAFSLAQEAEAREAGRKLEVAVGNALTGAGWLVRDLAGQTAGDLTETRGRALKEWEDARAHAERLMALVRGEVLALGAMSGATRGAESGRGRGVGQGRRIGRLAGESETGRDAPRPPEET
jgi:hypothetical protein